MWGNHRKHFKPLYLFIYIELNNWKGLLWFSHGALECMNKYLSCSLTKKKGETSAVGLIIQGHEEQMCQAQKSPTQQDFPCAWEVEPRRN